MGGQAADKGIAVVEGLHSEIEENDPEAKLGLDTWPVHNILQVDKPPEPQFLQL
jgi:hypothetical protein